MTKTKRQLRAEAVERLLKLDRPFPVEVIDAMIGDKELSPQGKIDTLIDLLTDDDSTISEDDSTTESLSDGTESREQLEADVREWWKVAIPGVQETEVNCINYNKTIEWLDRQAAITERECGSVPPYKYEEMALCVNQLSRECVERKDDNKQLHDDNIELKTLSIKQAERIDELAARNRELDEMRQDSVRKTNELSELLGVDTTGTDDEIHTDQVAAINGLIAKVAGLTCENLVLRHPVGSPIVVSISELLED